MIDLTNIEKSTAYEDQEEFERLRESGALSGHGTLPKQRVLVCGSEGSLMQAVIPKLIANGYKVYGVDNLSRYGKRGEERGYEFLAGDLTDPFFVDDIFAQAQPHYVIQAAAKIYGVGGFNAYRADILADDVILHAMVLKAAHTYNVKRVVYISSSMVYESVEGTNDEHEDVVDEYPAPKTDYGLSKYVGERLSKAYMEQYLVPYTIWRPFNIITPHETVTTKEMGISHVFADFINNIVVKKLNPLPIIGDGHQVRCFTWIDDVAQAIADHSFSDASLNMTFNLGNREPITMRGLAELIHAKAAGIGLDVDSKPLEFKTVLDFPNDVVYRVPETGLASNYLDWNATTSTETSVENCLRVLKIPKEESKENIINLT